MKQRFILVSTTLLVVVLLIAVVSCGSPPAPVPTPSAPSTPTPNVATVPTQGRGANGTLAKIDGNTLTLTTAQGPVTVSVDSSTTIRKTATASLSDIQEGAYIFASGDQDEKGNITAISIRIQAPDESTRPPPSTTTPPPAPRQRLGYVGPVTKIDGRVLTLSTGGGGTVTLNISSDAAIQKTVTGSLSDLREGGSLSVIGSRDANGNIAATSIRIQPEGQGAPNPPAGVGSK